MSTLSSIASNAAMRVDPQNIPDQDFVVAERELVEMFDDDGRDEVFIQNMEEKCRLHKEFLDGWKSDLTLDAQAMEEAALKGERCHQESDIQAVLELSKTIAQVGKKMEDASNVISKQLVIKMKEMSKCTSNQSNNLLNFLHRFDSIRYENVKFFRNLSDFYWAFARYYDSNNCHYENSVDAHSHAMFAEDGTTA